MHITKRMINRFQYLINMPSSLGYPVNCYATSIYQTAFTERKRKFNYIFKNQQGKNYSLLTLEMNIPEVSVPALISVGLNTGQKMSSTFPVQMLVFLKLFPWTMR